MNSLTKVFLIIPLIANTLFAQVISQPTEVTTLLPVVLNYNVSGSLIKKVTINVTIKAEYANLSIYANNNLILDNIDIPEKGEQNLNAIVKFAAEGNTQLTFKSRNNNVTINNISFTDFSGVELTSFSDISEKAGLDRVKSIKYGGPGIADVDQDGDYDFVVVNHNAETNKLYWNNGDGTVKRHDQNLSRWYMQDLHGVSFGDYDNDGDLDIIQTKGGGNGKAPSLPDFYRNDNGKLTLVTLDANITVCARGRGARWSDMDMDGDLDLVLINAKGIQGETPQHNFYRNNGNGTFDTVRVAGIEDADAQRCVVTDINGDNIDDFVMYDPTNTIWIGNGDFTFTNISSQLPQGFENIDKMMGATDIDIDNDGDFDLYFARGNAFGVGEKPSLGFCPVHMQMDIKIRNAGSFELSLEADEHIGFHEYDYSGRNGFKGNEFPVLLGKNKTAHYFELGGKMDITQEMAKGFPKDISENGIYFGHLGGDKWQSAVVINGDIFWNVGFSLSGVKNATPKFTPLNRNPADILLRNDGGKFTDVSKEWNIAQCGNHSGVASGDFNNDGLTDLYLYRWGFLTSNPSDYMMLNTSSGFEKYTAHSAVDTIDSGHSDMGQTFDFDLDGDVDMLNGSDDKGMWYLYENKLKTNANYALVKVGYAPVSNVDAISAEVIVKTATKEYRRRVGSSGEVFSQSVMNIVHFGLGNEDAIEQITVRWRDGETVVFKNKKANQIFDTDNVDPVSIAINEVSDIRSGGFIKLEALIEPINANKEIEWFSSDESVLKVDQTGKVTTVGKHGKSAAITAKCKANGLSAMANVNIVKWHSIAVNKIELNADKSLIYTGKELALAANIVPKYADNPNLNWSSSDESIATVDENGMVTGIKAGEVTITATSAENNKISGTYTLKVETYKEPGVFIENGEELLTKEFVIGDSIELTINYCAGSGNKVVAKDMGGVMVWFRQIDNRWMASGNYDNPVDKTAVGKESGTMKTTIHIGDELIPTSELPEGYVYYILVSMASSNGETYTKEFFPLKLVKK